jgi:hypothetical protein
MTSRLFYNVKMRIKKKTKKKILFKLSHLQWNFKAYNIIKLIILHILFKLYKNLQSVLGRRVKFFFILYK